MIVALHPQWMRVRFVVAGIGVFHMGIGVLCGGTPWDKKE
jgi:hypothetical protein